MKFKRFLAMALTLLMLAGMMPGTLPDIVHTAARKTTSTVAYAAVSDPPGPTPSTQTSQKHTHSFKRVKRVAPTCTKSGYDLYKCSGCGKTKKSIKSALGHKFGSWKVTRQADCTHTGVKTRKCTRCDKAETQTIKKTDHSFGSWKVTKEATCAKTGTRERKCKVCGKTQTETIGRTDHKYGEWTTTVEPNCAHTGTRERTCKVCGKTQTDTLRMTDHSFGEWTVTVPATDHSAGTRSRTCAVCGLEETENFDPDGTLRRGDTGDDVRALQEGLTCYGTLTGYADGDYGEDTEKAVHATQEAEGFEADGVAWPQTQNVLGHRFGEWETISELSDFSKLERRRVCQRCGYTETEEEWPTPMYRRGDSGDGVKALQQALNDAGYNCGWPDGDFGGNTERAVARIETAHGVDGDGIAWPGVLKWLGLASGGDDEDEDNDQDDVAGGITTYNAPKTAPEDPDYPVMPDMAEPFVLLTHEPVGVVDIKVGDSFDVKLHVTNTGDIPVKLKGIDVRDDESYSSESWMSGTLEPNKTYHFTYHVKVDSGDTKPSSAWREPMVTVIDPATKHTAYSTTFVAFSCKKAGARIALKPDNSYKPKAVKGQDVPVTVYVFNNGEVALKNLTFSYYNKTPGDRPLDKVDHFSDASLVSYMEPGKTLTLTYWIHVTDEIDSNGYSTSRMFRVTADPVNGAAAVKDAFAFGVDVVESMQSKVTVTKEEVSARPREEGYYPGEKIKYRVTVKNGGKRALELVNLYDELSDDEFDNFGTITNVKPGYSPWREFEYTVTVEDAKKGYVETAAKAKIEDDVEFWTASSEKVKTPCAKNGDEIDDTEHQPDFLLVVIPKDSGLTQVNEGDEIQFTLRVYNNGDDPVKDVYIRAYDGMGKQREIYHSDKNPLNPGKHFETEDKYVVTKEDAGDPILTLKWEAFGNSEGDAVNDEGIITFEIGEAKPEGGDEYGWEPPTEPEPEPKVSPVKMEPDPVIVDNVTLTLEIMTEMKHEQGFMEGDTIVYNVIAVNNGEGDINEVDIWDSLHGLDDGKQIKKNSFAKAGGGKTLGHTTYTIKKEDVEQGYLEFYGHVKWKNANGESREGDTDKAHLPLFAVNLTIEQTVVGGEDQILQKGDTVVFQLQAKNPSDYDVSTAKVYHRLNATSYSGMGDLIAENVTVPAHGSSKVFEIKHEVDDDDVIRGKVTHSGALWDGLSHGSGHNAYTKGAEVTVSPEGHEDLLKPLDIMLKVVGGEDQVLKQDDVYEIEYTVHNPRSADVAAAKIYASFEGATTATLVAEGVYIPAHKSVTKTRKFTVTGPDVSRGYIRTKGEAQDGLGTTGIHCTFTEWVKLTVEKNADADKALAVTIAIQGGSDQVFFLDDQIPFEITVENTRDYKLNNADIRIQFNGKGSTYLVENHVTIPAHKSVTKEYKYTVVKDDVIRTWVTGKAFVEDGIGSGEGHSFKSESAKADIGPSGDLQKPITATKAVKGDITKEYKEDDVIVFEITVNNPKSVDLDHVEIYDYPNKTTKGTLVTNSLHVPAHGSNTVEYPYTVTKDDVEKRGYVINQARAWDGINKKGGNDQYAFTNTVKVNLNGAPTESDALIVTKTLKEGWTIVHPDDALTFEIAITNPTATPIKNVRVYDHMNGDTEGVLVSEIPTIQASQIMKRFYKHTVDSDDLTRGAIDNYARITWDGQEGGDPVSNTVHLTVEGDAPAVTGKPLEIVKSITGGGTEFKVNDKITYQFIVKNLNSEPVTGVKVYDHMNGDPTGVLVQDGITIPANDSYGTAYTYTVTGEDLKRGFIDDYGTVSWDGQEGEDPQSETVHVDIVDEPGEVEPVEIVKYVIGGGTEFKVNDKINYQFIVKNNNSEPITGVKVYDHMNGDLTGTLVEGGFTVDANGQYGTGYTYIVTGEDLKRGFIDDYGTVTWDGQECEDPQSETVHVDIVDGDVPTDTLKPLTVTKAVQGGGTTFHVNDVITYTYTIYNPNDVVVNVDTVYDHMNGASEGTAVATNINVPDNGSSTNIFTYVVKPEDLTRGWVEDYLRLYMGTEEGEEPKSNTVHVDIVDGTPKPSGSSVSLFKWVVGKTYYLESEIVPFQIRVENHTGDAITNVKITDPLSSAPGKVVTTYASIPNASGNTVPFPYTVTHYDATVTGVITNTALVTYTDAAGKEHTVTSAPVTVYCGTNDDTVTNNRSITATVKKEVVGKPKNGKFYQEGEPIHYVIHVTYTGSEIAAEIIVVDPLKVGDPEVGRVKNVPSGYTGDFYFDYTVTGPDVDHTKVVNTATISVWLYSTPIPIIIDSLPVTSPTGREKPKEKDGGEPDDNPDDKIVEEPVATPAPVELALNLTLADSCVRTLIGKGEGAAEFAQTYCPEHARTADEVKKLLDEAEEAGTDEARLEAWQQAVALWTDAVNVEYEEWLARALDVEKPFIEKAQTQFFEQLTAHEDALKLAYPDQPETVAMKVSEQLMNQCVELCYEAHTAPNVRADSLGNGLWKPIEAPEAAEPCTREVTPLDVGASYMENLCERHRATEAAVDALLEDVDTDEALAQAWQDAKQLWLTELDALTNERYLAADAAGRDAIAAERVSFGNWLKALENTLTLAYPDAPQIVNEVMAGTIRSRVLDLCGEEQE